MNIPESIFHKIMLFNSHPVADLFNNEFEDSPKTNYNFYNNWCKFKYIRRRRNYRMSLMEVLDITNLELRTYWVKQWKREKNPKYCLGISECDCYDCVNSDDD